MVHGRERWVGMCGQLLDHGMDGRAKDHGRGWGCRDLVYVAILVLEWAVLVRLEG